jgi:hypothetical protein
VQGIDLVAATVVAPLAQQLGDACERRGEGGAHRLGGRGDLAGDIAREPAEPAAHAAEHALGLTVAAMMEQPGDLASGAGGDARVGLAQRDAVLASQPDEDLDAAVEELAVGRMRHRLGLDGGVDGDAREVLRLGSTSALCGGERLGEQQFKPLGADALAPAGHRGTVERQDVLEVGLAAEELDIGAVEEAGADGLIGEAVHVLDQMQPDPEAGRQSGPAEAVAVERAESGGEALPVDQASQAHQGMATVDEVHERRAGEFGLLGRRRFGRHRRAPARRRGEGITPLDWLQHERGFARFSPVADRDLANADTCRSQKAKPFRRVRRCSRATSYLVSLAHPRWHRVRLRARWRAKGRRHLGRSSPWLSLCLRPPFH